MQQLSAQAIRADHSSTPSSMQQRSRGCDADTAAPKPPGKIEEAIITERCSPVHRAPEAMQRPDAEWMEHFGDLLQYRDSIFEKHYPSAMLVT